MSEKDVLYVPNPGMNYYPKGSPEVLEGAVPDHPVDDKVLTRIRESAHFNGLKDGGEHAPKLAEVEPNSVSHSPPFEPEPAPHVDDDPDEDGKQDQAHPNIKRPESKTSSTSSK